MSAEGEIQKLNTKKTALLLSAGGSLDALSDKFEERPTQIALLKEICETFNYGKIGIFEAGTGVGKSYAYLLPAILWATENKQRVIVSTGTINLQQQLIEKDIPTAEKILDKKIKAVLIKGRQNYVCLRRLDDARAETDLFTEEAETDEFDHILAWMQKTESGSRSDLSFLPKEQVWSRINSESDACMGMRCRHFDRCFVMKVRKEAAEADILVVNHHLLFADIESRLAGLGFEDAGVLPPYKRVIFDEAHGMAAAATSFFSQQLTRFALLKQIGILYRVKRSAASGHLFTLEALSTGVQNMGDAMAAITLIKAHIQDLEATALDLLETDSTWRLCKATEPRSSDLLERFSALRGSVTQFTGIVREIIDGIDEKDHDAPAVWETKKILNRLEGTAGLCQRFTEWSDKTDTVFWFEKNRTATAGVYPRFYATPLTIAPLMVQGVFEPLDTVVCTSATLRITDSFDFWLAGTGAGLVEQERLSSGVFPSPFPYKKNMLLAIPNDTPLPDSADFQPYIEHAIVSLITAAQGRTLVLFTSHESLRSACSVARNLLAPLGIQILKQGEDDRFRLLETFKTDTASVLFATDSFWEGVDVPGESLSQVIIVKLPFSVPSDPVFAARSESIESKGGKPFMQLSLPEAVIKFRQGVGRLLRRNSDRGVVTILDRRVLIKKYGTIFLHSIPETHCMSGTLQETLNSIERFL